MAIMWLMLLAMRDVARSRARLEIELLAVRHQLHVLERTRPRRARLSTLDRWLWVWPARVWSDWRRALVIVEPATVIDGTAAAFAGAGRGRAVITRVDRLCRARFGS